MSLALWYYIAEAVVSRRCSLAIKADPLLFFAEVGWLDYKEHETSFEKGREILDLWYTFFKMAILVRLLECIMQLHWKVKL